MQLINNDILFPHSIVYGWMTIRYASLNNRHGWRFNHLYCTFNVYSQEWKWETIKCSLQTPHTRKDKCSSKLLNAFNHKKMFLLTSLLKNFNISHVLLYCVTLTHHFFVNIIELYYIELMIWVNNFEYEF